MNLSETSDSAWEVAVERSGAFDEAIVFPDYFEGLPDPRQRARVIDPLDEVLLPCLLAVLAGAERIVDIARFGEQKRDLLRRFRRFAGPIDRRLPRSPARYFRGRIQGYHRGRGNRPMDSEDGQPTDQADTEGLS